MQLLKGLLNRALLLTLMPICSFAQVNINYEISFPNYRHHEAEVRLTVKNLAKAPAVFRMSRSSAGRYATHEFGKNVYDVQATDGNGHPLKLNRVAGDIYKLDKHPAKVMISYTLYGDYADGTYDDIDSSEAHLNMPATFLWIEGHDSEPITVKFDMPEKLDWKVATQLKPMPETHSYYARNFQYLMDSPTELSDYHLESWEVENPDGKKEVLRLVMHAQADDSLLNTYTAMLKRMVREEEAVFGELPDYDYGTYTFIENVNPFVHGDGMEHRNSTFITYSGQLRDNVINVLSTSSHEFFHCWNVKRIRPRDIEPFDFKEADMSSSLWFAEGFTQYYGELVLQRAGFKDINDYCRILGGMLNYVLTGPAAKQFSPVTMSRQSVYTDAGVSIDRTNYPNIFSTYYYYGAITALALDFRLRRDYKLSLDDYMRAVWQRFGKPYNPYTNDDLKNVLGTLTKDTAFANSFFRQYIYGTDKNDYKALLAKAGLDLKKAQADQAWLGNLGMTPVDDGLKISSNTLKGQPIYLAGLDYNDIITRFDNKPVKNSDELKAIIATHQPGDNVPVEYIHREVPHRSTITLQADPALQLTPYEAEGKTLTAEMKQFRANWLGSKVK